MKKDHSKRIMILLFFSPLLFASCAGIPDTEMTPNPPIQIDHNDKLSKTSPPPEDIFIPEEMTFIEENGLKLKISEMEDIAFGYVHTGKYSPDYNVRIETEEVDPSSYRLISYASGKSLSIDNISGSPQNFTWSPSGRYVVFSNVDVYAGAGATGIILLNVQSGKYIEISREQIINEKDLGKREKLNIYNIVWLDSIRFSLIASAGYLGESGHPGINYNRMVELGENLGNKDDIILVANWQVEIVDDE